MRKALPVYLIHYDAPEWIASSARSLLDSDIPVSITVIDNGPDLASASLHLPVQVRVVRSGHNAGFAGGANMALNLWLHSGAEYAVIGAHDLHVQSDTLRLMMEAAISRPTVGIIGTHAGHSPSGPSGRVGDLEFREWVSGICMLVTRTCIERIGLFDETFHSYCEDVDICERARAHGFEVAWLRSARAHGLGTSSPDAPAMSATNKLRLAQKRGPGSVARIVLRYGFYILQSTLARVSGLSGWRGVSVGT